MIQRVCYFRDQNNIFVRKNGSPTRGNPFACLVSLIDREKGYIAYAISTAHPRDSFYKPLGRKIALGRLDQKAQIIRGIVPYSGHEITKTIMQDIVDNDPAKLFPDGLNERQQRDWLCTISQRVVAAARAWLVAAESPKRPSTQSGAANGQRASAPTTTPSAIAYR